MKSNKSQWKENEELTALIGRVCEGSGDVRVDGDHRLALQGHLLVPLLDPAINPVNETLAQDDAEAVDGVLPRPLQHLLRWREEFADFLIVGSKIEHVLDFKRLVQRHGDVLHAFALNDLKRKQS